MKSYASITLTIILFSSSSVFYSFYYLKNHSIFTPTNTPSSSPASPINVPSSSPPETQPENRAISDTVICIAGFLVFIFFLYRLFLAGKDVQHTEGPAPKSFSVAVQGFRQSKSKEETWFLVFLCSPMFVRYTFFAMFAAVATAGFTALAGICGLSPEALRVIFDGIDRILVRIEQIIKGR